MGRSPQDAKRAAVALYGTSDLLDIDTGFPEELQKAQESPAVTEALLVSGLAFARFPADQLRAFPQSRLSEPHITQIRMDFLIAINVTRFEPGLS